jgi:oligopeptide/dipeptide ABC transporter ATP-binding protein
MTVQHALNATPLLDVSDLSVSFHRQTKAAVDRVSFSVRAGSITGLVGASGAGKSSIARAIMGLVKTGSGEIRFRGDNILSMPAHQLKTTRQRIQMVFQEPSASLSPRRTIEQSLLEPMLHFGLGDNTQQHRKIRDTLATVGLDQDILRRYPHQFSSGQQQRIAIARALVTSPDLLIADEAVSSLDVSIQAQILQLIKTLQTEHNIAVLFITHDLAAIAQVADDIAVMLAGQLLEQSPAELFFKGPAHPYSKELLSLADYTTAAALPARQWHLERRLSVANDSSACVFSENCTVKEPICDQKEPVAKHITNRNRHINAVHCVKCHLYDEAHTHDP